MVELAWVAADGDVATLEALVQPEDGRSHFELAAFLAKQGKGADAVRQLREAGQPRDEEERALLRESVVQLLAAHQFSDAYNAWAITHDSAVGKGAEGQVLNGEFLDPIIKDDPGFGWQLAVVPSITASIDPSGPTSGARSLRIEFAGDNAAGIQFIHQLLLVQPKSRYSLTFMARTENLVSGGAPIIRVLDAGATPAKTLGESKPLAIGTNGWGIYQVDFSTDEKTSAVVLALQRQECTQSPCPIFGKLWLGRFSLIKA
jgi:hypothetical protein